jgi:hypothetical protein
VFAASISPPPQDGQIKPDMSDTIKASVAVDPVDFHSAKPG